MKSLLAIIVASLGLTTGAQAQVLPIEGLYEFVQQIEGPGCYRLQRNTHELMAIRVDERNGELSISRYNPENGHFFANLLYGNQMGTYTTAPGRRGFQSTYELEPYNNGTALFTRIVTFRKPATSVTVIIDASFEMVVEGNDTYLVADFRDTRASERELEVGTCVLRKVQ